MAGPELHEPTDEDNWPAHYEEYFPINQVNSGLWTLYVRAKQRQQTQGAPELPARRDGQGGMEKQGVSCWKMDELTIDGRQLNYS